MTFKGYPNDLLETFGAATKIICWKYINLYETMGKYYNNEYLCKTICWKIIIIIIV